MITPQIEFAVVLKIDFKLKASPYTVTTRYFAQSNYEDTEIQHNGTYFKAYGLIRAINGLGSSAEDVIPTKRTGTIVLDNTRGSTGHNLRFHDWLDKEEIIAQPIEVRYYIGALGSDIDTDGNVEFVGKVLNWSVDPGNGTIRINVGCDYFDVTYPQYQMNLTDQPTAPDRSIGQYLPLIVGSGVVPAYAFSSDADSVDFAYASKDITTYHNTGVTAYYTKNSLGDWVEVRSAATTTTKVFDNDLDGAEDASSATANSINGYSGTGVCVKLAHTSSTNYVITGGFFYFYDEIASAKGSFSFYLIEDDENGGPGKTIGQANVNKNQVGAWANDLSKDKIYFSFPQGIPLDPNREYWIGFSQTGDILYPVRDLANNQDVWGKNQDSWWLISTGSDYQAKLYYILYAYVMTDTPADNTLPYSYFTVEQSFLYGNSPDPQKLDWVVKASGLKDSSGGTITGTPSLDLGISAPYAIAYLASSVIGTPPIDPNTATLTTYPRRIDGATRGRVSIADICAGICRANACKVVSRRNGDLVIWSYGTAQTSQATISEDDCQLTSIDSPGTESIINSIDVAYAETAIPLNIEDIQTGQPRSFEETLSYDYDTDASTAAWSTDSFNLYGTRELNTGFVQMPWIRDDASAAFMSKYYMTVYSKPRKTAELSIPFLGKGYDTLELLDLITLVHIDMPNEYGTSADGVTPFPVEDGVVNTEINSSYMWHEAQAYTCRIIERKVNFNLDKDEMPTLDLKVQILDNPMEVR